MISRDHLEEAQEDVHEGEEVVEPDEEVIEPQSRWWTPSNPFQVQASTPEQASSLPTILDISAKHTPIPSTSSQGSFDHPPFT